MGGPQKSGITLSKRSLVWCLFLGEYKVWKQNLETTRRTN